MVRPAYLQVALALRSLIQAIESILFWLMVLGGKKQPLPHLTNQCIQLNPLFARTVAPLIHF